MISKDMLEAIKQKDVSINKGLTKERVGELWKATDKDAHKKVYEYAITPATLKRTRDFGNISVKVAAVLALITGADPYYLTAETDQNDVAGDENRIRDFIKEHGYEKELNAADEEADVKKPARKSKAKKAAQEPETEHEPLIIEEVIFDDQLMTIDEFAEKQMYFLPEDKKDAIYKLPSEQAASLLQTLELQAQYSERARYLLGLLRLILIR